MKNRDLLTQARDLLANSRRNRGADADALDEEWYRTDADFELDGLDEDDSLSERRGPSLAGRAGMGCLWLLALPFRLAWAFKLLYLSPEIKAFSCHFLVP